jgi:hypothetical protein
MAHRAFCGLARQRLGESIDQLAPRWEACCESVRSRTAPGQPSRQADIRLGWGLSTATASPHRGLPGHYPPTADGQRGHSEPRRRHSPREGASGVAVSGGGSRTFAELVVARRCARSSRCRPIRARHWCSRRGGRTRTVTAARRTARTVGMYRLRSTRSIPGCSPGPSPEWPTVLKAPFDPRPRLPVAMIHSLA